MAFELFDIGVAVSQFIRRSPPPERCSPKKPQAQQKPRTDKELTFRLECEFLLAYQDPSNTNPDPDPQDPRKVRGIVKTKTDYYMLETSRQQRNEAPQHITDSLIETGIVARNDSDKVFPRRPWQFVVGGDNSVYFRGEERGYSFMATEVKSPPSYYQKDSLLQVSGALQSLTSTYRLVCNNTTGVHVHIGYGASPDKSKPSRTDWIENNWHPRIAYEPEWKRKGLERILAPRDETDCDELVKLTQAKITKTRLCYNIDNLNIGQRQCKTFESRQHCGALSPDKILAWIKVCAGLGEFADTVEDHLLETFLRSRVDDEIEDYTAIDLLRAIGRPDEAEFYDKMILENDQVDVHDRDSEEKPPLPRQDLNFYDKRVLEELPSPKMVATWGPNGLEVTYELISSNY